MSGRDLVSEMREGGTVRAVPRAPGNPVDLLLAVVAIAAISAAGFFGVSFWLAPQPPIPLKPAPMVHSVASVQPVWTEADAAICKAKAITAANADVPIDMAMANRAVTEGFAGFSARLECQLLLKATRFCDPAEKAKAVAMVNDYLGRIDLVFLGLGVQGAPMRLLAPVLGGEVDAGASMYDMEKDATIAFMAGYQKRVALALQRLARDGIIAPGDFAGPLWTGVPKAVTAMFGDAQPARNACG